MKVERGTIYSEDCERDSNDHLDVSVFTHEDSSISEFEIMTTSYGDTETSIYLTADQAKELSDSILKALKAGGFRV